MSQVDLKARPTPFRSAGLPGPRGVAARPPCTDRSRRDAPEVLRIGLAPRACVPGNLWVRAQRPRQRRLTATARGPRGDDLRGRHARLTPPLERAEEVRLVRTHAAAAVAHAR